MKLKATWHKLCALWKLRAFIWPRIWVQWLCLHEWRADPQALHGDWRCLKCNLNIWLNQRPDCLGGGEEPSRILL